MLPFRPRALSIIADIGLDGVVEAASTELVINRTD
jgi:hypothetical protein